MGKKVKKDDKGPPDDVFDLLMIESRNATTVILMLGSPEEDVLMRACDAIYRFIDKSDDNKKMMLDLDAVEPLLKLISHEEKSVRRNAIMALSLMAGHPDVRRMLRKREDTIPYVVALLSPDEDVVVHEYATFCLSHLANDFTSKIAIYEQGTLEALIRLLSSTDPDVQKNSIETITLMLQDYQTKAAIRDLNGIQPTLDLLKSEYPVIQQLALSALQLATQEADNRVALREMEGVNRLIDFIGRPEYNDLHVYAVTVLSNCLEDFETMEVIKENGGLQRLVSFIMDISPPEEDDKKGKKPVEKGASRTGKKGKGEDATPSSMSKSRLGRVSTMPPSPPNGNAHQARAGGGATATGRQSSVGRQQLQTSMGRRTGQIGARTKTRAGNLGQLTLPANDRLMAIPSAAGSMSDVAESPYFMDDKRLKGDSSEMIVPTIPEVKEHASRALARAAKNADNRKLLHEQEVEKMLIFLLGHEDINVQVAAAHGIGVMALNMASCDSIGQWEGIDPLIKMLKSDSGDVREASAMALANLTANNTFNAGEIIRLHGVESLILLLSDTRELVAAYAAVVLTNMTRDEYMRTEMNRCGVMTALIEPLKSVNTVLQSKAALAIAGFVCDTAARELLREHNGIEPLVKLLNSGTEDVRRSASWAITMAATDEPTAVEIGRYGGLDLLLEIQLSSTRKNAFTQLAIAKLLDNNLSAKYAITGHLGVSDRIADGFFDAGPLKEGAKFVALDDYGRQEINQKRPVILINAKPENPLGQGQSDVEVVEKTSKSSFSGRTSRTNRDKAKEDDSPQNKSQSTTDILKSKVTQKEKEDKLKEDDLGSQTGENLASTAVTGMLEPYFAPGDLTLVKYLEDVDEKIMPLPTSKDQVVALAQFVALKMGGPIDRGQISNFSWELPMSQLKFDCKSNVINIGRIRSGIHCHRALLFKSLADRIAVSCTLVRGEYNRAWNEVMLQDDSDDTTKGGPKFPPRCYIVDLVHHPGRLMLCDSVDAINYQKL